MNRISLVAKKEIHQILMNKTTILAILIFIGVFGGMSAPAIGLAAEDGALALNQLLFYLLLTLGIFIGYSFSSQAFLREKQQGNIETILCTPLSIREIWLGKVIGVLIPAFIMTLLTAVLMTGVANAFSQTPLLPSIPICIHILFVVPAFIAVAVGILGFIQLLLGMRENQFINMGIIFILIVLISTAKEILNTGLSVTYTTVGILFAVAVLLLLFVWHCAGHLSKEKIVRTIP